MKTIITCSYTILRENTTNELEAQVEMYLKNGFELQGSVVVDGKTYLQVVILNSHDYRRG
jgi:sRNA-binding regulator protein Hfq